MHGLIIIGGGHNALVAAFYLARGGRPPFVAVRRPTVGGGPTTAECAPGYRCPALAHTLGPLRPSIVRDMGLMERVRFVEPDPRLIALEPDGRALVFSRDARTTAE